MEGHSRAMEIRVGKGDGEAHGKARIPAWPWIQQE